MSGKLAMVGDGGHVPIAYLWGVFKMNRRTKIHYKPIHVSIPVRTLEDLDYTLSHKQSRSKIITKLIQNYLEGDQMNIGSMTKKQIVVNLLNQTDPETPEYILLTSLLQIFS